MFTIKQLAKLAGITPRTLHYYDEIGLLIPSQIGDNGYRYYGDESLLRLQQILLYRELDMPLDQIKRIIGRRDFDVIGALEYHKTELRKRIVKLERLLFTIDHTILFLEGKRTMDKKQLFAALSTEEESEMEKEAMQLYDPETVKASFVKWRGYSDSEKQKILDEGNSIYLDIVKVMPQGAASPETQACVDRWRKHLEYFWTPNETQLLGLVEGYNSDPRFKANFDKIHPNLAEFMRDAVKIYVTKRKN